MDQKQTRDQQRLQSEILEKQYFGTLMQYVSLGVIIVNEEQKISLLNTAAANMFGYSEEELTGNSAEILIPERFRTVHLQHHQDYFKHPDSRTMGINLEIVALKKDGTEFPAEVSLAHFEQDNLKFTIAIINDITKRLDTEKQLLELNKDLERKVEEKTKELTEMLDREKELSDLKSKFVTIASHEFRTPLSTVLSSAYLIEKYELEADQPKRLKHLERIVASVNTLTEILNDFLSVGKIEEGKITPKFTELDIEHFFNEVLKEIEGIRKKEQHIIYEHTGNNICRFDHFLLKHIAINLLSNAIKFSPEKSNIYICTKNEKNVFTFSVKDAGIGIPQEDQEHLFERFFRGSNVSAIQGTGLGLHIVYKYTQLMNGTIQCKSKLGKGTEFILQFKK